MPDFKQPRRRRKSNKAPPVQRAEQRRVQGSANPPQGKKPATAKPKASLPKKSTKQKRRRNLRLYYALMLLFSLIIFAVLSVTVLFNLEEIVVAEGSGYEDAQIIRASGLETGKNIIRLNTKAAETRIINELIWLDSVTIDKQLPRSVVIRAERAVPIACIMLDGNGGEYYTISKKGRVLEKEKQVRDCPVVVGYEPAETEVGGYISTQNEKKDVLFEIIDMLERTELDGITVIDITDHLDIKLSYDNRITVMLGSALSLEQKLKNTREMLKTEIAENEKGTLRVTNLQKITFLPYAETMPEEAPADETSPEETEPQETGEASE